MPTERTEPFIRGILRYDAPAIVLAILTLAVGVVALTIWLLRRPTRDRALAAFGAFATLYGVRLLIDVWSVAWVLGVPRAVGNYAVATITYIIPISGVLFRHTAGQRR